MTVVAFSRLREVSGSLRDYVGEITPNSGCRILKCQRRYGRRALLGAETVFLSARIEMGQCVDIFQKIGDFLKLNMLLEHWAQDINQKPVVRSLSLCVALNIREQSESHIPKRVVPLDSDFLIERTKFVSQICGNRPENIRQNAIHTVLGRPSLLLLSQELIGCFDVFRLVELAHESLDLANLFRDSLNIIR